MKNSQDNILDWRDRIASRLKEKGYTNEDLALYLEYADGSSVGHWFKRRRTPSIETFDKVAKFLDTTTAWILFGVDSQHIDDTLLFKCIQAIEKTAERMDIEVTDKEKITLATQLYSQHTFSPPDLRSLKKFAAELFEGD